MKFCVPFFLRGLDPSGTLSESPNLTFRGHPENRDVILCSVLGGKSCYSYNLSEQHVTASWFSNSVLKITSGINCIKHKYYVVINNKEILEWDGQENKLEKVEKKLLSDKEIFDLLSIQDEDEVIVLFKNGSLTYLSHLQSESEAFRSFLSGNEQVLHYHVYQHKAKTYLAIITSRNAVYLLQIIRESGNVSWRNVSTFDLPEKESLPSFLPDFQLASIEKNELKVRNIRDFDEVSTMVLPTDRRPTAMTPINDHHLGLLSQKSEGAVLDLINVRFRIVLDSTFFKIASRGKLFSCQGHLFLQHDSKKTSQISIKNELKSDIASFVGLIDQEEEDDDSMETDQDFRQNDASAVLLYEILPPLIQSENIREIKSVIEKYGDDIPELLILSIVEVYLKKSESFDSRLEFEKSLKEVLRIPVTESLMEQYLRKSDFSWVKPLLTFCFHCVILDPEMDFALSWMSMVINAHYVNLQLTQDEEVLAVLTEMTETVGELEKSEYNTATLIPLISLIREKCPLKQDNRAQSSYCIEIIDI